MEFRRLGSMKPLTPGEEDKYLTMIPGVKKKERKNIFGW